VSAWLTAAVAVCAGVVFGGGGAVVLERRARRAPVSAVRLLELLGAKLARDEGRVVVRDASHLEALVGPEERKVVVRVVTDMVTVTVSVREAPKMRVTLDGLGQKLSRIFAGRSIVLGDARFDAAFHVETKHRSKVFRALSRGQGVKGAIMEAFRHFRVHELAVGNGAVHVTARLADVGSAKRHARLVAVLVKIARAFDRVLLRVKIFGGDRLALVGAHGKARCAYCHDDLTGEEPDLVACDQCATVLHAECWSELGACPLLGCTGRSPERAGAS
jgi:Zn finger protein HypA/HybF involved in hydrogenase expression